MAWVMREEELIGLIGSIEEADKTLAEAISVARKARSDVVGVKLSDGRRAWCVEYRANVWRVVAVQPADDWMFESMAAVPSGVFFADRFPDDWVTRRGLAQGAMPGSDRMIEPIGLAVGAFVGRVTAAGRFHLGIVARVDGAGRPVSIQTAKDGQATGEVAGWFPLTKFPRGYAALWEAQGGEPWDSYRWCAMRASVAEKTAARDPAALVGTRADKYPHRDRLSERYGALVAARGGKGSVAHLSRAHIAGWKAARRGEPAECRYPPEHKHITRAWMDGWQEGSESRAGGAVVHRAPRPPSATTKPVSAAAGAVSAPPHDDPAAWYEIGRAREYGREIPPQASWPAIGTPGSDAFTRGGFDAADEIEAAAAQPSENVEDYI